MRPNTYNPDCDFDPDQRDLDASIKERNKTESDATERARADAILQKHFWHQLPQPTIIDVMVLFLESETPRIKADAVWEFVAEVEKEANRLMDASKSRYGLQSQIGDHYPSAIQQVQARQIKAEIEGVK